MLCEYGLWRIIGNVNDNECDWFRRKPGGCGRNVGPFRFSAGVIRSEVEVLSDGVEFAWARVLQTEPGTKLINYTDYRVLYVDELLISALNEIWIHTIELDYNK